MTQSINFESLGRGKREFYPLLLYLTHSSFEETMTGDNYLDVLKLCCARTHDTSWIVSRYLLSTLHIPPCYTYTTVVHNYLNESFVRRVIGQWADIGMPPSMFANYCANWFLYGVSRTVYSKKAQTTKQMKDYIVNEFHSLDSVQNLCHTYCKCSRKTWTMYFWRVKQVLT